MRACTLVAVGLMAGGLGCGGSQTTIGSSVGQPEQPEAPAATAHDAEAAGGEGGEGGEGGASGEAAASEAAPGQPEPEPPPDPALVKALVDKTGDSTPFDNELHVRLEVTPRPVGERWLVAVVNRGTEPASVELDLRRLTLELETPDDPKKPRPKWKKKPAPTLCKLPPGFGGTYAQDEEPSQLAPGEGLLRTFDPRLYCISAAGDSLMKSGQTVTVKLGSTPKPPRIVWRQGKRTEVPSLQSPPFVAEPVAAPAPAPASAEEPAAAPAVKVDPEHDRRVKQLVASPFELTVDLTGGEAEEDPTLPLSLKLLRGSDVSSERTATALLEVRAKAKKTTLYFRRELVSFTVHGPDGIRACDPQPDDRAPDRQAYSTLAPGRAITATVLLAEVCPNLTFGRPGLYLLSARLDAIRDGSEFGLRAFTGRLESRRQALLRIRSGDLPPLPAPEPLRVRVGQ